MVEVKRRNRKLVVETSKSELGCSIRIEKIGRSHLNTDSEVWGLDQTTWVLMWAGKAAMQKGISALRHAGYESISNLP